MTHTITPIAKVHSVFPSKFGIPRQSGLTSELKSYIVFEDEFRNPDVIRGLSDFSHIWLIWGFSENAGAGWSPTVRPPRLGGNKRVGVFATRSPFRPNGLGLSSVKLEEIIENSDQGPVLCVTGADIMDGTPVYDIKPYIYTDCHSDADSGFADRTKDYRLSVRFENSCIDIVPDDLRKCLISVLSQDPRPSYHDDPDRIYGFPFAEFEIKFRVDSAENVLTVTDIIPANEL